MFVDRSGNHHLSLAELTAMLQPALVEAGASDNVAKILALNCATAERDGSRSHGLYRVSGYIDNLRSGFVNGKAVPDIARPGAAMIRVDACRGYGRPALEAVIPEAIDVCRMAGTCVIAIGNSHHNGPLWLDIEPFADDGLVALTMVASVVAVVPHGARRPVYGTNPMAFAVPRHGRAPLIFDQSSSVMAHGEVGIAALEGRILAEGVGIDAAGNPTRDPKAIMAGGALLPFGGHKGSQIAMMIELLAGAVTGSNFSHQVDWSDYPGACSAHTGQLFILIDPVGASGGSTGFALRVEELLAELATAGQERFPGERRIAAREKALREGISIEPAVWEDLLSLGAHPPE